MRVNRTPKLNSVVYLNRNFKRIHAVKHFRFLNLVNEIKSQLMDLYATIAGYGFLIIITLFFLFFIVRSTGKAEEIILVKTEKHVLKNSKALSLTGDFITSLNLVYYSVISLILLQIIMFILLI